MQINNQYDHCYLHHHYRDIEIEKLATMSARNNRRWCLDIILIFGYTFVCSALASGLLKCALAYPTANLNMFAPAFNKLDSNGGNGPSSTNGIGSSGAGLAKSSDDSAERSFHQLVNSNSNSDSTLIGELKPNASALEMMLLRNKIANTILSMQEMDKQQARHSAQQDAIATSADCFIEVTRVSRQIRS